MAVDAPVARVNAFTPFPPGPAGTLALRTCTVSAKPRWLLSIPDAIEPLDRALLTRRDVERLFGVSNAAADEAPAAGSEGTVAGPRSASRRKRRQRLVGELRKARLTGIRVKLPVESLGARLASQASLPEGVTVVKR